MSRIGKGNLGKGNITAGSDVGGGGAGVTSTFTTTTTPLNCPENWEPKGGKCVPIGWESAIDWEAETDTIWGDLKTLFGDKWSDYGEYFDEFDTAGKEMLEGAAATDITQLEQAETFLVGGDGITGQLFDAWDLSKTQLGRKKTELGTMWDIEEGRITEQETEAGDMWKIRGKALSDQKTGLKTVWDLQSGLLEDERTAATTLWGLQSQELADQSTRAGEMWAIQSADLLTGAEGAQTMWGLQEAGLKEEWDFQKAELDVGARTGLKQARKSQAAAQRGMGFATAETGMEDTQRELREQYGRTRARGEAGLARSLSVGEEQLMQTLADIGYKQGAGGLEETGFGQLGAGAKTLENLQAGITGRIDIGAEQTKQQRDRLQGQIDVGAEQLTQAQARVQADYEIAEQSNLQVLSGLGHTREVGKETLSTAENAMQDLIDTGQMTYDQAVDTAEFETIQSTTDINQALEKDIFGEIKDWKSEQRSTLNSLLGSGIDLDPSIDDVTVVDPTATGEYYEYGTGNGGACTPVYNIQGRCVSCCDDVGYGGSDDDDGAITDWEGNEVGWVPGDFSLGGDGGGKAPDCPPNNPVRCPDGRCVGKTGDCNDDWGNPPTFN